MYMVPQRTPAPNAAQTPRGECPAFACVDDAIASKTAPKHITSAPPNIANRKKGQRVRNGPETSCENSRDQKVRRAADVRANGGCAEDQGGQAPPRQKNANDHDEGNHKGRNADGNQFRRRFGGAKPGARRETRKDSEQLQLARARCVGSSGSSFGRQCRLHMPPAGLSMNETEKKQSAQQHRDRDPKMNIG